jgi:DNA polymerase III epsilon subunit-like protein
MTTYLVFDTETTGLPLPSVMPLDKQPRIIEFGAALVRDGKVVDSVDFVINPGMPLPEVITKITGLTDADLEDAPPFGDMLPAIRELFEQADVLVAHNAEFDTTLLKFELKRLGVEEFPWPKETLCTVQEFTHRFGRRPKLTELYEHSLGKKLEQTHRALDDVMALVEVLNKEEFW